jgi:hypothetical protein
VLDRGVGRPRTGVPTGRSGRVLNGAPGWPRLTGSRHTDAPNRQTGTVSELDERARNRLITLTGQFTSPAGGNFRGNHLMFLSSRFLASLPRRDAVSRLVMPGAVTEWSGSALRLGVFGQREWLFDLKFPTPSEVIHALLSEVTSDSALSADGLIASALSRGFDLDVLMRPGALRAIGRLATPRSKSLARELGQLNLDPEAGDVRELISQWGGRVERRFASIRDLVSPYIPSPG